MTAKKHDASTRFWYLVEKYKSIAKQTEDSEWNNPVEMARRIELSCSVVPGNPLDDSIGVAFASIGFNVRDPLQWKLLLALFCLAHFGEWPKPAAHKLWTSARLEKLYEHVAEIRSRRPGLRDEAIARILKESKQYRGTYGQYSKKYIGERIRDARNSKDGFEDTLKKHLIFTRGLCEAIGLQWTSELESERSHSFKETARRISGASAAD